VLLSPYLDRVTLSGPDVFLEPDPSFALSSAVHELATNASKYGSLSGPAGRSPYLDRVTLSGPDVFLEPDPSFALSSAVHELATNASKYGSLSGPAGPLD